MKVVLDTNIFVRDWYLDSPPMRRFEELRSEHQLNVLIPEVVRIEVVDKFREKVSEAANLQAKAVKDLVQLTAKSEQDFGLVDVNNAVNEYARWLDKKLLNDWGATTIPIPAISHTKVVERLQGRKKPFNKNAKYKEVGYKDYLIWESILSVLNEQDDQLNFITDNSKDFLDGGVLFSDLLADLPAEDSLVPHGDVHSFTESQLIPITAEADDILQSLISGAFDSIDWHNWVKENYLSQFDNDDLTDFFTDDEVSDLRSVFDVELQEIRGLEFTRVGILSDNRIAVNINVQLFVNYQMEVVAYFEDEYPEHLGDVSHDLSFKNEKLNISFSCVTNSDRTEIIDSYYVNVDTNYVSVSTPFYDNRVHYQRFVARIVRPI